mmetsp:Transcript_1278/g.3873  ORF Transcript_1278/g.3873 Transcript_1278/m.3873 type:complete len:230 (-) Transcript_1278:7-696(-)
MLTHHGEHHLAHRGPVVAHRLEARPLRRLGRVDDVVPAHLVDARLQEPLQVAVQRLAADPGDAELVDRERGGMPVVEDQRVPQPVRRGLVETALLAERREQHLRQRPAVLKVVLQRVPQLLAPASQPGRRHRPESPRREPRALRGPEPRPIDRPHHRVRRLDLIHRPTHRRQHRPAALRPLPEIPPAAPRPALAHHCAERGELRSRHHHSTLVALLAFCNSLVHNQRRL